MRIGKYPVASIVLLIVFGARLFLKLAFPDKYLAYDPVFDKILMATLIIFTLYYIRIWVGAWLNNRREETNN
ncbi:hypothetical protein [Mucilaginibacter sp.]|uniref:hypothetical protein n=1 Tax=Mucilaginibacter sp. TaxID=1882438 RepID=UPI002639FDC2|nr:hypothetical protein [Mucilaginibacter sp.]MDB4925872.1 hypothetical protein [Mucilaginibacter sp.]